MTKKHSAVLVPSVNLDLSFAKIEVFQLNGNRVKTFLDLPSIVFRATSTQNSAKKGNDNRRSVPSFGIRIFPTGDNAFAAGNSNKQNEVQVGKMIADAIHAFGPFAFPGKMSDLTKRIVRCCEPFSRSVIYGNSGGSELLILNMPNGVTLRVKRSFSQNELERGGVLGTVNLFGVSHMAQVTHRSGDIARMMDMQFVERQTNHYLTQEWGVLVQSDVLVNAFGKLFFKAERSLTRGDAKRELEKESVRMNEFAELFYPAATVEPAEPIGNVQEVAEPAVVQPEVVADREANKVGEEAEVPVQKPTHLDELPFIEPEQEKEDYLREDLYDLSELAARLMEVELSVDSIPEDQVQPLVGADEQQFWLKAEVEEWISQAVGGNIQWEDIPNPPEVFEMAEAPAQAEEDEVVEEPAEEPVSESDVVEEGSESAEEDAVAEEDGKQAMLGDEAPDLVETTSSEAVDLPTEEPAEEQHLPESVGAPEPEVLPNDGSFNFVVRNEGVSQLFDAVSREGLIENVGDLSVYVEGSLVNPHTVDITPPAHPGGNMLVYIHNSEGEPGEITLTINSETGEIRQAVKGVLAFRQVSISMRPVFAAKEVVESVEV